MKKGYWEHQLREALSKTYEDEEPQAQTDKDTLRKHLSEAGRKGGSQPKIKFPILIAVAKYIHSKKKAIDMTNKMIAASFCRKHPQNDPVVLPPNKNGDRWEIFSSGDLIFMRVYEAQRKSNKYPEKSITNTTLQNDYIPKAKRLLQELFQE